MALTPIARHQSDLRKKLHAALALLGKNGEHWTPHGPEPGRGEFCAVTALCAAGLDADVLYPYLPVGHTGTLALYNDRHSFDQVRELFRRAIRGGAYPPAPRPMVKGRI